MRLKLELTKKEIAALRTMYLEAASNAEVMLNDGTAGGQLPKGRQIMEGIRILREIIALAEKRHDNT